MSLTLGPYRAMDSTPRLELCPTLHLLGPPPTSTHLEIPQQDFASVLGSENLNRMVFQVFLYRPDAGRGAGQRETGGHNDTLA